MPKKEFNQVIKTIEDLFSKESYESVDEGIRIVKEENDPRIYEYFLDGIRFNENGCREQTSNFNFKLFPFQPCFSFCGHIIRNNKFLNFSSQAYLNYALYNLIAIIPSQSKVDPSIYPLKINSWDFSAGFNGGGSFIKHSFDSANISFLKSFENLSELILTELTINDINIVKELPKLTKLSIYKCKSIKDIDAISSLTSLEYLRIEDCQILKNLDVLSKLSNLKKLTIKNSELNNIDGISNLNNLKTLEIQGSLKNLNGSPKSLEKLTIVDESGLEDITGIEKLINLKTLRFISKSISSKQYNSLSKLVNLENLDLSGNTNFKNTKSLINLTLIKDLNLAECQFIKHVNGLKNMLNLKKLNLDGCGRLENVDGLYNLTQLEEIDLNYCIDLININGLSNSKSLKKLRINLDTTRSGSHYPKLTDINSLKNCTSLENVELKKCHTVVDFSPLSSLKNLKKLTLWGCIYHDSIANLGFLKSLKNIVDLYIYSYEKPIKDLTLISGLTNLQKLNLSAWKNLKSIDGIEKCVELEHLNLSGAISLKHINPIINFNKLSYLSVQNTSLFPDTGKYGEKYASEMLKLEIDEYKDRIKKTK
jgi:Leucine-rich repeat (LRR) protein